MGILDKIKEESKKAGQSKGKFIYFREGEKVRIRFLTDLDEGMEIVFHDNYEKGVNVPCQEIFGKSCPYCDDDKLRTRSLFAWSVYDYEAKDVKILMQAVNNCTAVPALMALYENYQTLTDRDLVVQRTGKAQNTAYSVVPMDKNKFRNEKAKPLSEKAILKYINQAYPVDSQDDDEDEEDYSPKKYMGKNKKSSNSQNTRSQDDDWDDEEGGTDYSEMSARELYNLCDDRGIDCKPKKSQKYYINLLEEDDKAHDDWDDEEEDEWEDE